VNLEHDRLPPNMISEIENAPCVGVSPVSCFELALAHRRGRLKLPLSPRDWFARALAGSDVKLLPLTAEIAARAVDLADIHRDPFDRIIIATAIELNAKLASLDGHFVSYPELADRLIVST
jgi:PIN domain nuclease of toxin-antitoxin system